MGSGRNRCAVDDDGKAKIIGVNGVISLEFNANVRSRLRRAARFRRRSDSVPRFGPAAFDKEYRHERFCIVAHLKDAAISDPTRSVETQQRTLLFPNEDANLVGRAVAQTPATMWPMGESLLTFHVNIESDMYRLHRSSSESAYPPKKMLGEVY